MAKGFEASIAVVPETQGWGTTTFGQGFYMYTDSESLSVGQEFKDRPDKLVFGRAERLNSRSKAMQKPNGDIEVQFRSNDSLPLFMGHFQKYTGTLMGTNAGGTAMYTFVPEKGQPDWVGSTYGTGGYTAAAGDMFTFGVLKKILDNTAGTGNSMMFKNCIVDQLAFNLEAGEDAKITASIIAGTVDIGTHIDLNPDNATFGSYSTLSAYESWEGTLSVGGRTDLQITSIQFTSVNNAEAREVIGKLNPTQYDFGNFELTGVVNIDAPKEALWHLGSMVSDKQLAITGTLYNGANDYMVFNIPNAKYQPFDVNISGANEHTEYGLAFKAFADNADATAPITLTVRTSTVGSAFTKL